MGQADLRYHPNCRIKDTTAQISLTQSYAALSHGGSGVAAYTSRKVFHRPTSLCTGGVNARPFKAEIYYSTLKA